jgi:energy-coupling factor transporter ATP-binding protein EcfA2
MNEFNDTFNAKHLQPDQLIETFVPSKKFDEVAQNGHTILLGPRGSGKTTLLRMLSVNVLPSWEHKDANAYRSKIKYEGVYVPGDTVWGDMLNALSQPGVSDECAVEYAYSGFSTHIFLSAISAIEESLKNYTIKNGESLLSDKKNIIVESFQTISKLLKIDIDKYSISRIRNELYMRLSEIGEYPAKINDRENLTLTELRKELPYSNLEIKQTLDSIFDCLDRALGRPDHRWAILLDEFEIAPKVLLDKIIRSMRSSAQKVIFKVALVPCGKHQEIKAEISNIHDHKVVELWYRDKSEIKEFCNNILSSKYGIKNPEELFGKTKYINNTHGTDGLWKAQFKELEIKDPSFKRYIKEHKIDIEKVFSGNSKASNIRKIAPRVAFRNAFKDLHGNRKGRKSLSDFYAGWDAISRISEGNPRWLIATINSMLLRLNEKNRIEPEVQYGVVKSTCEAFSSMIASTALQDNMGISTKTSPYEILTVVSEFFRKSLIDDDFKADPAGTFVVDVNVNSDIENSLRIALNHGAIVLVDRDQDFWNFKNLHGMRFRISYLLSPKFNLPLRMEKERSLSSIMHGKLNKNSHSEVKLTNVQAGLFDE